jgi:Pyridine nucleotide-disulphide oxidoreductase
LWNHSRKKYGPNLLARIAGGGFAGLNCAKKLSSDSSLQVTLIDRNNYQQFQPLLYQVATGILSPENAAFNLRDVFIHDKNVEIKMSEIVSVDLAKRQATGNSGDVYRRLSGPRRRKSSEFLQDPRSDSLPLPFQRDWQLDNDLAVPHFMPHTKVAVCSANPPDHFDTSNGWRAHYPPDAQAISVTKATVSAPELADVLGVSISLHDPLVFSSSRHCQRVA